MLKLYLDKPQLQNDNLAQPFLFENLEVLTLFVTVEIPGELAEWLEEEFRKWRVKEALRGKEHEDFLDKILVTK